MGHGHDHHHHDHHHDDEHDHDPAPRGGARPVRIGVGGPVGSGKTTLVGALCVLLREELSLPAVPRRIECYDNSNIQGSSPVSSMVVFVDGRPAPNQYRRFRVKNVVGADDFATMQEILRRRFKRAAPVLARASAAQAAPAAESCTRKWLLIGRPQRSSRP